MRVPMAAASASQAAQSSCEKHGRGSADSSSGSSPRSPYQPIAEPLTRTDGGRRQPADQASNRLRGLDPRGDQRPPSGRGPKPARDRGTGEVDDRVDARRVGDLVEAGDEPVGRREVFRVPRVTSQRDDLVAGGGQRPTEAPADEARRAGDEHVRVRL